MGQDKRILQVFQLLLLPRGEEDIETCLLNPEGESKIKQPLFHESI